MCRDSCKSEGKTLRLSIDTYPLPGGVCQTFSRRTNSCGRRYKCFMASKTGRWFRKILKRAAPKRIEPGTGRFVKSAVQDAIYGREPVPTKPAPQPGVPTIIDYTSYIHVNYSRSDLLCAYVMHLDPVSRKYIRVKKSDAKKRITSFYRRDGTVYDGSGPVA